MWSKARAKPQYVDLSLSLWPADRRWGGGPPRRLRCTMVVGAGLLAAFLMILAVWGGQW